jgi:purine-binding chemotaxis protein CheW
MSDSLGTQAPSSAPSAMAERFQIVTFRIDDRFFGVEVQTVREIKSWIETTPLPHTPPHVRGVLNLRGDILVVYDLRARLGLGLTDATPTHVIVVVSVNGRLVGLLVDSVFDILTVGQEDIRPLPEVGSSDAKLLTGVVMREKSLVALLDLEAVVGEGAQNSAASSLF